MIKSITAIGLLLTTPAALAQETFSRHDYQVEVMSKGHVVERHNGSFSAVNPGIVNTQSSADGKQVKTRLTVTGNNSGTQVFYSSDIHGSCDVFSKDSQFSCETPEGATVKVNIE